MSDDLPRKPEQGKWEVVKKVMDQDARSALPFKQDALQSPPAMPTAPDQFGKPEGIIASYKAAKVQREATLDYLRTWYREQLEVTKHRLAEAARVRKTEATVIAEQFLRELDQRHLEYLSDLGLRNVATRQDALAKLTDQTSGKLRELQERDWPPELQEQTIKGILDLHKRFFDRLMEEIAPR
jgi:hypothetical protein